MLKLCPTHYQNTLYQVLTQDETQCKFCIKQLEERMRKFGYTDWKKEYEEDRDKFIN